LGQEGEEGRELEGEWEGKKNGRKRVASSFFAVSFCVGEWFQSRCGLPCTLEPVQEIRLQSFVKVTHASP